MAINVSYSAINWENRPSTASPINATNLNKMDTELGNAISALNGLSKSDIGLGNVDNTSDANKPISNATQTALNNKVNKVTGKGLSTNDYTSTEKTKLAGIETNANKTIVDSILSSSSTNPVQNKVVNEFKLDKGETAVSAKGIILATPVREEAPYVYRKTPVASSLNAKMRSIIGGSVAWNQLAKYINNYNGNGATVTNNSNGSITITGTPNSSNNMYVMLAEYLPVGHKYYCKKINTTNVGKGGATGGINYYFAYTGANSSFKKVTTSDSVFLPDTSYSSFNMKIQIGYNTSITYNDTVFPQLYDLTQMFGSEIADYVYTLEQATAGSGIAWLQSYGFFTEDYYAYDTGSIQSVNVSGKKVVGKNLIVNSFRTSIPAILPITFNIDTIGRFNFYGTSSSSVTDSTVSGTNGGIKLRKGHTYRLSGNWSGLTPSSSTIRFDLRNSTATTIYYHENTASYTPTEDLTVYLGVRISANYTIPTGSFALPCLTEDNADTTFEPYETTTYLIDSSKTLRGLFKLATNKLTVDGDIYNADGSLIRKYGLKDLSTLSWEYDSTNNRWESSLISTMINYANNKVINGLYTDTICVSISYLNNNPSVLCLASYQQRLWVRNGSSTTSPTGSLVYELATTTSETANPFIENEKVGTEEFIDYGVSQNTRDVAIPVGTETDYYQGMELPPLPTASGNHNLQYNPSTGFGWS